MRRRVLPVDEQVVVSSILDPEQVVKRDGPKVAAWLVWTYRRKIRRDGQIVFDIVVASRTTPWFLVGIEFLKRRAGWNVLVMEQKGKRSYRVEWLGKKRLGKRKEVRSWTRN